MLQNRLSKRGDGTCRDSPSTDALFDKDSQERPRLGYPPVRLGTRPWAATELVFRQELQRIQQCPKVAIAMPGTATRRVAYSFLPSLFQERDSVSDSKLARIGMAIVSIARTLVVGRHLTIVSAKEYFGGHRLRTVVDESFQ